MEIMVEFIMFTEDFPVEEISAQIGIDSCKIVKKGDVRYMGQFKQLSRIETHTSIMYSTGYIQTVDVKVPIRKICDMLLSREKQILEYIERYKLNTRFCVVINLTDNPIIELSREFIDLASRLHAEIDFDSYVNYDDDGNVIGAIRS